MTWPLAGLNVAFQPAVMVCPPGSVNASDQLPTGAVPVFVMVIAAVRPVFHAFTA
ncbi:hypothetical protein JCM33774_27570 [Actinophytocola sp. KF-1]